MFLFGKKKKAGEPEAQKGPPKRGWILIWSVFIEILMFAGAVATICLSQAFLSGRDPTWTALAGFVGFLIFCLMPVVGFLLVYFWWAPNNLFWTFVPEGRAKMVVRGDAVMRILVQWKDHAQVSFDAADAALRPDVTAVSPRHNGDVVEYPTKKRFWGGLRFYGLWPLDDMYVYNFKWTNMTQGGEPQPHDETMDHVLLKDDVYWATVKAAEDQNLLPLDVGLVLRLRVVNPYKALFKVENWLEVVVNMVEPSVRYVLSSKTYKDWVKLTTDLGDEIWKKLQEGDNGGLVGTLRERYGIEFISLGVKSFDPSSLESLDEARRATIKMYLAEQEAERIRTEATGKRDEASLLGEGAAAGIAAVQKLGSDAMQLRGLEIISKPGNTTFVLPGSGTPVSVILPSAEKKSSEKPGPEKGGPKKKGAEGEEER